MGEMELICFKMIAGAGEARTNFINAIEESKKGNMDEAQVMIEQGDMAFNEGHLAHAQLLQKEAAGTKTEINLLLMHAEDQLMCSESFRFIALELIELYKRDIERV